MITNQMSSNLMRIYLDWAQRGTANQTLGKDEKYNYTKVVDVCGDLQTEQHMSTAQPQLALYLGTHAQHMDKRLIAQLHP